MELQETEKLYDLTKLKKIVGENKEFLVSLAGIYLTTVPANSKEMLQAAEAEDWLAVSKIAHKIKPTADTMNIKSITADIRLLEANNKNEVNKAALLKIAYMVDEIINIVAEQLKFEFNI